MSVKQKLTNKYQNLLFEIFFCRWTQRLMFEYFAQGDKEKELDLPISPLCDRENSKVAQSQIGKSILIL